MANVEHSTLTGSALHEPKGVASAAANRVYVSNGLGSGTWTALSNFNAFGAQLLHVRDQRSAGTSPQSLTNTGTWQKRDLQTTSTNEISGASLSSSVITLPAGTYYCTAVSAVHINVNPSASSTSAGEAKLRLRNTTAGTDLIAGHSMSHTIGNANAGSHQSVLTNHLGLSGRFTLAGSTNIELQMWTDATLGNATFTGGAPINATTNELYSDILIWKVA
jgi:hypothetical protein